MADSISVEDLLLLTRDIAGLHGQSYFDNDRLTRALNRRAKEYWRELTATEDGHGLNATTATASLLTPNLLALPTGTLELRRLDRPTSGTASKYETATRIVSATFPQVDDFSGRNPGYYLLRNDDRIALVPAFTVAEVVRLWVDTTSPALVDLTDEIECLSGFEYVLAWGAAADLMVNDPQKRAYYEGQHDRALQKVRSNRGRRDRGPDRVRHYDRSRQLTGCHE